MPLNFKKYAEHGEAFLKDLAEQLGTPDDRDRAARILKTVLHLLREQISPQESSQLLAQMPMFLKAVYVDGWRIGAKQEKIRDYDVFISEVRYPPARKVYSDFDSDKEAEEAIYIVFNLLQEKISHGEMLDIAVNLPKPLRRFLEPRISSN